MSLPRMKRDRPALNCPDYTPVRLLDAAARALGARNDLQLARALEMDNGMVCRIRHRKQIVTDRLMIDIMDRTGWTIDVVRKLAGMPFDGPPPVSLVRYSENRNFEAAA